MASSPAAGALNLLPQLYQPTGGRGDVLLVRAAGELGDEPRQGKALREDDIL